MQGRHTDEGIPATRMADDAPEPAPAPDARVVAARARDSRWVAAALDGDADAFARLYDAWSSRVFDLVVRIVPNRHVAQDVCQDVFFAAWRNLPNLQDHDAFGGWLLRIARNTALNQASRESRSRAVDDTSFFELMGAGPSGDVEARTARADDPEAAVSDAEIAALVREVAASLDARDAEVLDLQLRYEMTPNEIGEVIGVNRNAANQMCHRARQRFATAFGARMLWRGNRPGCDVLDAELQAAGVTAFGRDAVRLADRHAEECDVCSEHRRTRLTPAALFSAVPVLAAPVGLRELVAAHAAGAPLGSGGAAVGGATGGGATGGGGDAQHANAPAEPEPEPQPVARSRRPLALAAAVALVLVVVIGALVLLLGQGDDASSGKVAARRRAADPTVAGDTARKVTPTSTRPTAVLEPATSAPATASPPTTRPATNPTTPPPAPSLPVIAQLSLAPADPMYGTFNLDATSPLLSWQVNGADSVRVVIWFDDGVHGNQQLKVYSTAPSGSARVCPGTNPTPGTCSTMNGYYTFVVEATSGAGTVTSSRTSPPGFHVYPIIG